MLKMVGFILLLAGSFFVPSETLKDFSQFARIGSILFLMIQVLVVVDFAFDLHEMITRQMAKFAAEWQEAQTGPMDERTYPGIC